MRRILVSIYHVYSFLFYDSKTEKQKTAMSSRIHVIRVPLRCQKMVLGMTCRLTTVVRAQALGKTLSKTILLAHVFLADHLL